VFIAASSGWEVALQDGVAYVFGRSSEDGEVNLPLGEDDRIHRRSGTVTVDDRSSSVANEGAWLPLLVVDLDGTGELRIDPNQVRTIPFCRYSISIDLGDTRPAIRIETDQPASFEIGSTTTPTGAKTVGITTVSKRAGYFKALVALCEPRLLDPTSHIVPTDQQIAARINQAGIEPQRITADIVERRLAYCRERLGLRGRWCGQGAEDRQARHRLLEFVLNNRIVELGDLERLSGAALNRPDHR
jgi:serine/threonine-protein kinase